MEDKIDMTAGFILQKKTGDAVRKGDIIAELYTTDKPEMLEKAAEMMLSATEFADSAPEARPLVFDILM